MQKNTQKLEKKYLILFFLTIVGAILGSLMHALFGYSYTQTSAHAFGADDAFITYRYAYNLFHYHRLCFNLKGCVEGYSNFLYLILMLPAFYFSESYVYIYSIVLNMIFFIACISIFFILLRRDFSKHIATIGTALFALNPDLWAHVSSGMESILVLLVFLLFWISLKKYASPSKNIMLVFMTLLSVLARVDGFILPMIAAFFLYLKKEKKSSMIVITSIAVSMIFYTFFRLYYYHDIIANTYYAKVTGNLMLRINSGIDCLYRNCLYNGFGFYFFFTFYYFIKYLIEDKSRLSDFPMLFFSAWLIYFLYIGGDIYFERFLLPLFPISIYFFMLFISSLQKKHIKYCLALIALSLSFLVYAYDGRFAYQKKTYDAWENLGEFLYHVPHQYHIAIDGAGKIPFYSKLYTIDMLGLNNRAIAKMPFDKKDFIVGHNKYNADYILALRPELIGTGIYANLDAGWGLSRKKYFLYYRIKYLVNVTRHDLGKANIINVQHDTNKEKSQLIKHGYRYAVLVRRDLFSVHTPL
jgi:arabinofuranosyltransferase